MKVARTVLNGESGSNAADLHNDTIYRLNADLISAKCILKYDDKYLLYKNEYIERSYTERMTVNDAEEACNKGKFPQLITYFSCDSVHLLFMRMNGFLYSGFYYPDTKEYKEASSLGKIPIENDIDKSFLFSPRCVEGNKVYCVIEPSEIPENNNLPINVGIDDNPVLAEIYMKYGNKKHKLKNYNLIIFCSLSLCLLYYTNRTNVDIRKK